MIVNSVGKQPSREHTFRTGESTTVHIDANQTKLVYVANAAAGAHPVRCDTVGDHRRGVPMKRYDSSLIVNQWTAVFSVTPITSGDYTIRCTGAPSDRFGVGGDPGVRAILTGVLCSIAGAFLIVVGLSAFTVTAWLRRRRSP